MKININNNKLQNSFFLFCPKAYPVNISALCYSAHR